LEFILLRRTLNRRIGHTGLASSVVIKLWCAAIAAGAIAWATKLTLAPSQPVFAAMVILVPYGAVYFALTYWLGVPEVHGVMGRVRRYTSRSP
jgi:putative peptidoglycan lipid II flippase